MFHSPVNGSLQRNVHHKPCWNGQYIHFHSFVPLSRKRNLVRCLAHRTRMICSVDTLAEGLRQLSDTFKENGYPEAFLKKNLTAGSTEAPKQQLAPKRKLYLTLPFRGDSVAEILRQRLCASLKSTFYAAELQVQFTSRPLFPLRLKDKLPVGTTSMCIYQFVCSGGATYIGRTTRRLSQRMREHHPKWLCTGQVKSSSSSIIGHLVDSGHRVDPCSAFTALHCVTSNLSHGVKSRMLAICESIAIRLNRPTLCVQEQFVRPSMLPWPSINNSDNMNSNRTSTQPALGLS